MTACHSADTEENQARYRELTDLMIRIQNEDTTAMARLDSLEQAEAPTNKHERMLRKLARCWSVGIQTATGTHDSVLDPIISYLEQYGTPQEQTMALLLQADSKAAGKELEEAQAIFMKAQEKSLQSGDLRTEMQCQQRIGDFYALKTKLKGEASKAYHRLMQLAEESRDTNYLAMGNLYLGRLYMISILGDSLFGRWQEGVEYYRKAVELAGRAGNKHLEMTAKYEAANVLMNHQDSRAIPLLKETKDYFFRVQPDYKQPILLALIMNYLQLDQPDSAQVYIDEAFTLPDYNHLRHNIFDMLFQYYRAKRQPEQALWAADSMRHYEFLTLTYEMSTKLADIKEKYDNERLVNEQQRLKLEKAETQRTLIIVTLCLVVLIAVTVVLYQKRLLRKESTIRQQSEQLQTYKLQLHDHENRLMQNRQDMEVLRGRLAAQEHDADEYREQQEQLKQLEAENTRLTTTIQDLRQHIDEYAAYVRDNHQLVAALKKKPRPLDEDQWQTLTELCDSTWSGFVSRLRSFCPPLTEQDIRLCVLIRLRFNNSQQAAIFAVSPASVSQKKFRLKKRLSESAPDRFPEDMTLDEWLAAG